MASDDGSVNWGTAALGALPVVGSVVSSLINNSNVAANNDANRAFALQQMQAQEAYNTQQIQEQEAYNSPIAQVQRLRDAGLNPALAYGGSGAVTGNLASPIPAPQVSFHSEPKSAPDLGSATAAGLAAYNNLKLGVAQTNNLQAQTVDAIQDSVLKGFQAGLTQAQTGKTDAETGLVGAQTLNTEASTATNNYMRSINADFARAQTSQSIVDTQNSVARNMREQALQQPTLQAAYQTVLNLALDASKTQAETVSINNNAENIRRSGILQNMDIKMKNEGVTPGSSIMNRMIEQMIHDLGFGSTTGGKDDRPGDFFNQYKK